MRDHVSFERGAVTVALIAVFFGGVAVGSGLLRFLLMIGCAH
jgi:hypothetical protein